jgi:hypothetical protein
MGSTISHRFVDMKTVRMFNCPLITKLSGATFEFCNNVSWLMVNRFSSSIDCLIKNHVISYHHDR